MDRSTFPVRTSVLDAAALREQVLPEYGISTAATCELLAANLHDTYRIQAGDRTFFLRAAASGQQSRELIESEADLLRYLDLEGVAVVRPISTLGGEDTFEVRAPEGPRFLTLFEGIDGVAITSTDTAKLERCGALIADLHTVAAGFPSRTGLRTLDASFLLDAPLARLRPFLAGRAADEAFLTSLVERLRERLNEVSGEGPEVGVCHGDLHLRNFLWSDQRGPVLFDFEFFGQGFFLYDLAVMRWQLEPIASNQDPAARSWKAFLGGYHGRRPLRRHELELIPLLVLIRNFWSFAYPALVVERHGREILSDALLDRELPKFKHWAAGVFRR